MSTQFNTVLYPVKNLDKAKATYTALFGAEPHVDAPYYVGYSVEGHEIGLVPSGHDQGMTGPEPFYDVDDLNVTLAALRATGGIVEQEPTDVGGGMLVARVRDTEGNVIGLRQPPAS